MNQKKLDVANEIVRTINNTPIYPNSVIIYDIDDTLLDGQGSPIIPIIYTYQYAKNAGLIPVIITARPGTDQNIEWTKVQLENVGVSGYKYMYFRPYDNPDHSTYKLFARKNLFDRGYNTVISIGDMPWDIGQYGGLGFQV